MFNVKQQEAISKARTENPNASYRNLSKMLIETGLFNETSDSLRLKLSNYFEFITIGEFSEFEPDYFEIPESHYTEPDVLLLEGRIGILNDIHLPFHDKRALAIAIDYLDKLNLDYLVLNGDVADVYSLSKFERNPNYRDLNFEISIVNKFLDYLGSKFTNIIFKEGNHEVRLVRHISDKAPELSNIEGLTIRSLLNLDKRNIRFIDNRGRVKAGKLTIIHGNEINNGGQINVARVKILRAMDNLLFGHHHATQEFTQRNISEKVLGAWSVGCLCGINPEYAKFNGWNHGFAWVEVDTDGTFQVHNKKILNYKVM